MDITANLYSILYYTTQIDEHFTIVNLLYYIFFFNLYSSIWCYYAVGMYLNSLLQTSNKIGHRISIYCLILENRVLFDNSYDLYF